jgi:hypothetical protein
MKGRRKSRGWGACLAAGAVVSVLVVFQLGCSVDIFPVSKSRLRAARRVSKVEQPGPGSPGYFVHSWSFAPARSPSLTLGGGFLMDPAKVEISGGSVHLKGAGGKFPVQTQVIQATTGLPYVALDKFEETTGPGNKGIIKYQLSNDGQRWYWFDGSKWTAASPHLERSNSASETNDHIKSFSLDVGAGSLYFKALLNSPTGAEPVELQKVDVGGIAPENDSWD